MNKLPIEEMIDCESYYHLADYHYEPNRTDFPSGIVHCDMGSIPQFFNKIRYLPEKYVVISSRCDFGLHYQSQFAPFMDYGKAAKMFFRPDNTNFGYDDIVLKARMNKERCNPNDKYSLKCYMFTEATFDQIPLNVKKWFVTNNTIHDDDRIVTIPFGINGVDGNQKPKQKIASTDWNENPQLDLYINFQFYTNERLKLYELYRDSNFGMIEKDVPFDWYINNMIQHNCVLCPCGNGWDCYRTLETLYLGCIPIMEFNLGTYFYSQMHLPIIFLHSLESISIEMLKGIRESAYSNRKQWNLEQVSLSYWKNKIEESRRLVI